MTKGVAIPSPRRNHRVVAGTVADVAPGGHVECVVSSLPRSSDQPQAQARDLSVHAGHGRALTSTAEDVAGLFSQGGLALALIESLLGAPGLSVQFLVSRTVVGIEGDWWAICVECRHVAGPVTSDVEAARLTCGVCEERRASDRRASLLVGRLRHVRSLVQPIHSKATATS